MTKLSPADAELFVNFMQHAAPHRQRVKFSFGEVYFRKTRRYIAGNFINTLDIATIAIKDSCQGKGYFTALLNFIESHCLYIGRTIYIENVGTKRFSEFFSKHGYTFKPTMPDSNINELPHCYYKN